MLKQELMSEREENEQTIERFTIMCKDLQFKGMDEVEDLQSEISMIRDQMRQMAHQRAHKDIKIEQLQDQVRYFEEENQEMRQELRDLKFKQIQQEIDREMQILQSHGS
jgi:chromosome segregation ATPase